MFSARDERTRTRLLQGSVALALTLPAAACVSERANLLPGSSVIDSAGVVIAQSAGPSMESSRWHVDSEPLLQIGAESGEEPYLFTSVWDAVALPGGGIVVSEGRTYEIRVFDQGGTHIDSFGRPGEGPGEFGGPPWLALTGSDTLIVWDPGHFRMSWYGIDGTLHRQRSLQGSAARFLLYRFVNGRIWQTSPDGRLLWNGSASGEARPGLVQTARRFVLLDSVGAGYDYGEYASGEAFTVRNPRGTFIRTLNPYLPTASAALSPRGGDVAISFSGGWEVRLFSDSGDLKRILRANVQREPITQETERQMGEALASRGRPGLSDRDVRAVLAEFQVPDSLPALAGLRFDTGGNLWVGRHEGWPADPTAFDVFTASGEWITSIRLPVRDSRILEISEDRVLSVWTSELGVPFLRVYELVREY